LEGWYGFALGALSVWRVTHLLHAEDGPGDILLRLRRRVHENVVGKALECFYCLSLWVAAPAALLLSPSWEERAWLWPALSGAAILLERATAERTAVPTYWEDPEPSDVMLRQKEDDPDSAQ
jgi:hypothetical protein